MDTQNNLSFDQKRLKIKKNILIDADLFYSEAFRALSASAIRTLLRCLQKRNWEKRRDPGTNHKRIVYLNEPFIFPYQEAHFLGVGTTQYWKNMTKLIEVGFVEIVHQGGWYQQYDRKKDYSVYKLSDRWKLYGTDDFKKVDKPLVLQPDFYVRKNIEKQQARATSQKRSELLHDSEGGGDKEQSNRLHESEADGTEPKHAQGVANTN